MARLVLLCAFIAIAASTAVVSAQTFSPALFPSFSSKFTTYTSSGEGGISGYGEIYADVELGLEYMELNMLGKQTIGMTTIRTCTAQTLPFYGPLPVFWWLPYASPAGADQRWGCQKFVLDVSMYNVKATACLATPTQLTYANITFNGASLDTFFRGWINHAPPRSVFVLPTECRHVPIQPAPPLPFISEAHASTTSASGTTLPLRSISQLVQKARAGDNAARDQVLAFFLSVRIH